MSASLLLSTHASVELYTATGSIAERLDVVGAVGPHDPGVDFGQARDEAAHQVIGALVAGVASEHPGHPHQDPAFGGPLAHQRPRGPAILQ